MHQVHAVTRGGHSPFRSTLRSLRTFFLLVCVGMLVTACGDNQNGGGASNEAPGFDGATTPATVNDEPSARDLGMASAETARHAKTQSDLRERVSSPPSVPSSGTRVTQRAHQLARVSREMALDFAPQENAVTPFAEATVEPGNCGGTVSASGDQGNVTLVFDQFCNDGGTVDGKVDMTITQKQDGGITTQTFVITYAPDGGTVKVSDADGSNYEVAGKVTMTFTTPSDGEPGNTSFSFQYTDVSYTDADGTHTLNMTCDADGCQSSETFTGRDGTKTYRTEKLSFNESSSGGFDLQADRVYDETLGYFGITTTQPLTFCDNGYPMTGEFTITTADAGNATVAFSGCDPTAVTVTYTDAEGATQTVSVFVPTPASEPVEESGEA